MIGFLKKVFGNSDTASTNEAETTANPSIEETNPEETGDTKATEFDTLRDDGIRAMRIGEFNYAERCFQAALERKDDEEVKGLLAELYIHSRDGEKALALLEELSEKHPNELKLLIARTQAARICNDWEKMAGAADAIAAVDAENPNAAYCKAEAELGRGNYIAAIALLTQLIGKHPDITPAYELRAKTLFTMQQFTEAEKDIDLLVEKGETTEEIYLLQGDCRRATGNADGALESYNAACELNPFNREALLRKGEILVQTKQTSEALALYDEAIELQPDFAQAFKARGGLRLLLHDEAGAADDLKKALELSPEEGKKIDGEYTAVQNEMNARYRAQNPFGF